MLTLRSFACCSLALLALSGGCSETVSRAASFAFERPELVELVCLDPVGDQTQDTGSTRVLPMACCSPDAPSEGCSGAVLHALVTQSVRGEVASVDLVRNRVLDSNELIPGFTFVDVGGLPTGLVAPPHAPDEPAEGPPWTYVASAEEQQVRAVPTCRFRDRQECGPERELQDLLEQPGAPEVSYETLRTVPLPAAPADMLLAGNTDPVTGELREQALWVSLPSMGALARIPISRAEDTEDPVVDGQAPAPFAVDDTGPREPQFFGVPRPAQIPLDRGNATTDRGYELVCGVGYEYEPESVERPLAPLASFEGDVQPTRMRLVRIEDDKATEEDEAAQLLFVADETLPVVHVFALTPEGGLLARPALSVGAPLKDFAVTTEVPASVDEPVDSGSRDYLYGIDRRDGSVMAFGLTVSSNGATVTPLLAPLAGRYQDRLQVGATPPSQFVDTAVGVEVIDTRGLSPQACVPSEVDDSEVGPDHLRGVFVAVVTSRGELSVLDVLDLDLPCRATACEDDGINLVSEDAEAVAVRRHALRLEQVGEPQADISGNNPLVGNPECGALPVVASGETITYSYVPTTSQSVCVPPDPWNQLAQVWSIAEGGAIPGLALPNATFASPDEVTSELEPGQFVMLAPTGVDLCQRGIMDDDRLQITSAAPQDLSDRCPRPSEGTEPTFRIVEAYNDRLILQATEGDAVEEAERIQACYPEFFNFRVRANPEQYLVIGGSTLYLHRMTAAVADGRCVENPDLDPRFTSRAVRNTPYVNPYVAFTLSPDFTQRTATVRISGNRQPLIRTTFDPSGDFPDALPASVRFFPFVNELFVVDSARQGLRRFELSPFQSSTDPIR